MPTPDDSPKPAKVYPAKADDVIEALREVFNLGRYTGRVVIDLEPRSIARIIRVEYLTEPQAKALADTLKQCNTTVI